MAVWRLTITVIVCAYNEAPLIPACLYSLRAQTRPPEEIVVINNASTDETRAAAAAVPGVTVVDEPVKGLVMARETARRVAHGDIVAYVDADCRAPIMWLERLEARFQTATPPVAVTGPYQFYDWDWSGRTLIRLYDVLVAPPTHALVHRVMRIGAILYGGNFAVRRAALHAIGGFDTSIEFHGEDTNLGRRLFAAGKVALMRDCYLFTSARRYVAMGKGTVIRLYVRNFTSEILHHRPKDETHVDVRI